MEKLVMEFRCGQDYEQMPVSSCGRFCEQCQKPVLDMTEKTVGEIRHLASKGKFCGVFSIEQVERGWYPVDPPGKYFRKLMATAAAFAGFSLTTVHAQEKKSSTPTILTNPERVTRLPGDSSFIEKSADSAELKKAALNSDTKTPVRSRPKYYLSWRFPFIHKARKVRRLMGCPKF